MKLRNKKTGEVIILIDHTFDNYTSLAELTEDWEDYEEPKGKALYWMILTLENFIENEPDDKWVDLEDCKRMLEKLKAWERLKDKGFRFKKWDYRNGMHIDFEFTKQAWASEIESDLDLLFGGEE